MQSAFKADHATETTLVKVFNDIVFNVDSGSGLFLLLLDLSSALGTIDYDLLGTVFERHLGTALKLLKFFLTATNNFCQYYQRWLLLLLLVCQPSHYQQCHNETISAVAILECCFTSISNVAHFGDKCPLM